MKRCFDLGIGTDDCSKSLLRPHDNVFSLAFRTPPQRAVHLIRSTLQWDMTSDLDIYRTASILIRERGEDAAIEAAMRADRMLEKGDMEGCVI